MYKRLDDAKIALHCDRGQRQNRKEYRRINDDGEEGANDRCLKFGQPSGFISVYDKDEFSYGEKARQKISHGKI